MQADADMFRASTQKAITDPQAPQAELLRNQPTSTCYTLLRWNTVYG